ncbi:glycosyltransferase family 9 protein, partial [Alphaproteobacteria bacterium]|nr:glycosyltransferase family 9 protein [Alphaproteobacteria bacterium]
LKKNFYLSSNLENNFFYSNLADEIIYYKDSTPIYEIHKKIFNFIEIEKMNIEKLRKLYSYNINSESSKFENYSVGVIPFCSSLSKERKLSLENWTKILNYEKDKNAKFYIFGDISEHFLAIEFINYIKKETGINNFELLTKNYSFNQKINILNRLNIIYTIDTGYNHIARVLNKKINSYWGASDPHLMLDKSYTTDEKIHYTNLPCSPCVHKKNKLPCNGDNICMEIDDKIINKKINNSSWLNYEKY